MAQGTTIYKKRWMMNNDNITQLHEKPGIDQAIVDMLAYYLALARRGEVVTCAVLAVKSDKDISYGYFGSNSMKMKIVGLVGLLLQAINDG